MKRWHIGLPSYNTKAYGAGISLYIERLCSICNRNERASLSVSDVGSFDVTRKLLGYVGLEVHTVVGLKSSVFRDITSCGQFEVNLTLF